jgi:hypothetical protein
VSARTVDTGSCASGVTSKLALPPLTIVAHSGVWTDQSRWPFAGLRHTSGYSGYNGFAWIAHATAAQGGCGNSESAMELSGAAPRRRKRRPMRVDRALLLSMGFIALFFTMVRPAARSRAVRWGAAKPCTTQRGSEGLCAYHNVPYLLGVQGGGWVQRLTSGRATWRLGFEVPGCMESDPCSTVWSDRWLHVLAISNSPQG